VDRSRLDIHDLVLIENGQPELGKTPSSSTASHRAIYQRQPLVQAIINAYPSTRPPSAYDATLDSRRFPKATCFCETFAFAIRVRVGDGRELPSD